MPSAIDETRNLSMMTENPHDPPGAAPLEAQDLPLDASPAPGDDHDAAAGATDYVRAPAVDVPYREWVLRRLEQVSMAQGKVLFDGEWITPEEARRRFRGMRWAAWRMIFESILLLLGLVVAAWLARGVFLIYVG
jgi:hypothetical protein